MIIDGFCLGLDKKLKTYQKEKYKKSEQKAKSNNKGFWKAKHERNLKKRDDHESMDSPIFK